MEQNGQNNGFQHTQYGHNVPMFKDGIDFNNDATGSAQFGNHTPVLGSVYPTMGTPLNASSTVNIHDVAFGVDSEISSPNSQYDDTTSTIPCNDQPVAGDTGGPRVSGPRGMLRAHAVGPARSVNSRNAALHHPYARPQPRTSQSQLQTEVRRNTSRRAGPAGGSSTQTGRNAYTRPRSQLNDGQSQLQADVTHAQGNMSASGHAKTKSSSSSNSIISPVGSNNVDTQVTAAVGVAAAPSDEFVRPIHETVDSTRVDPAGPDPHPEPEWRAPGPSQWTELLYNYKILQYMSDASIKDLMRHCDTLVNSGVPDPSDPDGPALLPGSRYTVADAQAVWNYCTAYSKRRQQLRNNSAASKSRNSKAAQLKHWKAIALAGGAANRDFIFEAHDPANAPGADPKLLSEVTQAAIQEMRQSWVQMGGPEGQGSIVNASTGLVLGQPPQIQVDQPQMQQQSYDQAQVGQSHMQEQSYVQAQVDQSQTQQQFYDQPQNTFPASVVALPSVSTAPDTAPDTTNSYQQDQNDVFEDFKQEAHPLADSLLDQLGDVGYNYDLEAVAALGFDCGES